MASFYFKAVASDGKLRTGTLTAPTEKSVAAELRKQGLSPVYVGPRPPGGLGLKLPSFGGNKRRDVFLFTQELSTLLISGVPIDRALSITSELTEGTSFRGVVLDVVRVLKAASLWPIASPPIPTISRISISTWSAPGRPAALYQPSSNV